MSYKSDATPYSIPQGWMIVCQSWENDADNWQTNTEYGLTEEQAKLKCDLLALLHPDSEHSNLYEPGINELEGLANSIAEVATKYGYQLDEDTSRFWEKCVSRLQGSPSEGFYTRVAEDVKVFYVPFTVEFPNVTDKFVDQ